MSYEPSNYAHGNSDLTVGTSTFVVQSFNRTAATNKFFFTNSDGSTKAPGLTGGEQAITLTIEVQDQATALKAISLGDTFDYDGTTGWVVENTPEFSSSQNSPRTATIRGTAPAAVYSS